MSEEIATSLSISFSSLGPHQAPSIIHSLHVRRNICVRLLDAMYCMA